MFRHSVCIFVLAAFTVAHTKYSSVTPETENYSNDVVDIEADDIPAKGSKTLNLTSSPITSNKANVSTDGLNIVPVVDRKYSREVKAYGQLQCSNSSANLKGSYIELWEEYYTIFGRHDNRLGVTNASSDGKFDVMAWMYGNDRQPYLKVKHKCCPTKDCYGWINLNIDWEYWINKCDREGYGHCPLDVGKLSLESLKRIL
ncbi:transthyretin-like family domain-containing protein [Ditylenchus destructor]|uniref:Transthyretin-like family domain-containing protein n=1 Tax=Ditylenchus destructor TaxID=166010 RepID=A0AAD4MI16_9BILA|nr:transthyretin-like family domain-containing protein [Ditylenchus destructor]